MNQILLGVVALCWTIWLNRNDMVFHNVKSNTFMLVYKTEEAREILKKMCRLLETVIMEVFAKFG
jgi:hypothetical protein